MSGRAKGSVMSLSAKELAAASGGRIVVGSEDARCESVSTDSRTIEPGALFVALKGPNFDGACFAAAAIAAGATMVLVAKDAVDRLPADGLGNAALVAVDDTLHALGELAAWHRRRLPARLVAISGSNGKTSTKQMTAAVLGGSPGVLFNRGNFNNLIGMPRALLELGPGHAYAVMEMGMSARGEIARLAEIAAPQIGLITNVHPVHLEDLGTIEQVALAKAELIEALPEDGVAVLNADDPHVLKVAPRTRAKRVTFGRTPNADVCVLAAEDAPDGVRIELAIDGRAQKLRLARPGLHNALNAAAAAAVGWIENVPAAEIGARLERARLPGLRMEQLEIGAGRLLIDCYNANPRSMQAAIETLVRLAAGKPSFAVLGDMRELGQASGELHRKLGRVAANSGLAGMYAFGRLAGQIADSARAGGMAEVEAGESIEQAGDWAADKLFQGAWVLLKGSRAVRLERIAERLAAEAGLAWPEQED